MGAVTGWTHIDTLRNYASPPEKAISENHVSGYELEIPQKSTYAHIVTENQIIKIDGS